MFFALWKSTESAHQYMRTAPHFRESNETIILACFYASFFIATHLYVRGPCSRGETAQLPSCLPRRRKSSVMLAGK